MLDPEQNHSFSDHYLDLAYDLSKVLFIGTANLLDPILGPLKDRMEILEFLGYTFEEKVHIAQNHLIPKQLREHGSAEAIEITEKALIKIVMALPREASETSSAHRRPVPRRCGGGRERKVQPGAKRTVDEADVESMPGPEKFYNETAERARRSRASRPASRGRRPAATSSSSRRRR